MEKLFKTFKIKFASFLIFFIISAIYKTCKINFYGNKSSKKPVLVLFWHGRLAMMAFAYKYYFKHKQNELKILISNHSDGEIITQVMEKFNLKAIRGSSRKGAASAMIGVFKELELQNDIAITPDGPKGPFHSIADGIVNIAQKKNVEICFVNYEADKFWQFKSWDKMILPKPFSTINFYLTDPINIDRMDLLQAKKAIENLYDETIKFCKQENKR